MQELQERLTNLTRVGFDATLLVWSAAAAGPLPDDHPAAALWWRILDQLSQQTPNHHSAPRRGSPSDEAHDHDVTRTAAAHASPGAASRAWPLPLKCDAKAPDMRFARVRHRDTSSSVRTMLRPVRRRLTRLTMGLAGRVAPQITGTLQSTLPHLLSLRSADWPQARRTTPHWRVKRPGQPSCQMAHEGQALLVLR
jgi:hypothetical protein